MSPLLIEALIVLACSALWVLAWHAHHWRRLYVARAVFPPVAHYEVPVRTFVAAYDLRLNDLYDAYRRHPWQDAAEARVRAELAAGLVRLLVEEGYVEFVEGETDPITNVVRHRAYVRAAKPVPGAHRPEPLTRRWVGV